MNRLEPFDVPLAGAHLIEPGVEKLIARRFAKSPVLERSKG